MDTSYRNRKYHAFLLVILLVTGLLAIGSLTSKQFTEIVIFSFGLYMAGNVGEHVSKVIRK